MAAAVALFFAELCPAGIHPTTFKEAAAEPAGAQYPGNVPPAEYVHILVEVQAHGFPISSLVPVHVAAGPAATLVHVASVPPAQVPLLW